MFYLYAILLVLGAVPLLGFFGHMLVNSNAQFSFPLFRLLILPFDWLSQFELCLKDQAVIVMPSTFKLFDFVVNITP